VELLTCFSLLKKCLVFKGKLLPVILDIPWIFSYLVKGVVYETSYKAQQL